MISVLHIASFLEPLGQTTVGGAERCLMLLSGYQAIEQSMTVLCLGVSGSNLPPGVRFLDLQIPRFAVDPIELGRDFQAHPCSLEEKQQRQSKERQAFAAVFDLLRNRKDDFDIIHNHAYDETALFELNSLNIPIVQTLHLPPILPWINERLHKQLAAPAPAWVKYVTVSKSCADEYSRRTNFRPEVIPCGEDLEAVPFSEQPESHFLWVGRISPEKGLHTAIELVVDKLAQPLRIFGGVYNQSYYEAIRSKLEHPLIDYRGQVSHAEILQEMSRAKALVFTAEWPEPFGLVLIEALAAGTPVIAFNRGAAREIIRHGETGFIAKNTEEFTEYLKRTTELSRTKCREDVLARFSLRAMAEKHLCLYQELRSLKGS